MAFPTGAAIAGGASIISSIAGNIGQRKRDRRQQKYNKELANMAYEHDLAMWNRQNAYNAPKEQMARFQEAGLNPNLIYGQGTPGNATDMPEYQAMPADLNYKQAFNPQEALGQYNNMRAIQAQIDNTKASTRAIQTKATLEAANIAGVLSDNVRKKVEANVAKELEDVNVSIGQEQLNNWKIKNATDELKRQWQIHHNRWEKQGLNSTGALGWFKAAQYFWDEIDPGIQRWIMQQRDDPREKNFSKPLFKR